MLLQSKGSQPTTPERRDVQGRHLAQDYTASKWLSKHWNPGCRSSKTVLPADTPPSARETLAWMMVSENLSPRWKVSPHTESSYKIQFQRWNRAIRADLQGTYLFISFFILHSTSVYQKHLWRPPRTEHAEMKALESGREHVFGLQQARMESKWRGEEFEF